MQKKPPTDLEGKKTAETIFKQFSVGKKKKNSWDAKSFKVNVNTVRSFKNTLVL